MRVLSKIILVICSFALGIIFSCWMTHDMFCDGVKFEVHCTDKVTRSITVNEH